MQFWQLWEEEPDSGHLGGPDLVVVAVDISVWFPGVL